MSHDDKTDIGAALGAMASDDRRPRQPLDPDDVVALLDDELPAIRRFELAEQLAADPESLEAWSDLRRFHALEPDDGSRVLSDSEVEARWRRLQARRQPDQADHRQSDQGSWWPRRWLATAAGIVLASGLALWIGSLTAQIERLSSPRPNPRVISLTAERSTVRSAERDLHDASGERSVVLIMPYAGDPAYERFRLEVKHPALPEIVAIDDLVFQYEISSFTVELPSDLIRPGDTRVKLLGANSDQWDALTTYELHIRDQHPPRQP